MDPLSTIATSVWQVVSPNLWWLAPLLVSVAIIRFPMLGRGPHTRERDVWRGYRFDARERVFQRAGNRCEAAFFFVWGRCSRPAIETDHVFPWSRGGPTVVSNAQALCREHNLRKGSMEPPWWYVLTLERRRVAYFPDGEDVTVLAVLNNGDRAARERWLRTQSKRRRY